MIMFSRFSAKKARVIKVPVRLRLDIARLRVNVRRNATRDELGRDAAGDVDVDL